MERTIEDIVETLRNAVDRGKKCSVLIGAGCSVTAGIPIANEFVEIIKERYPRKYERAADPKTYSNCMSQLSYDERRDLIQEFVNKDIVNWGHIALAQLMKAGFVDQVLTTNFDSILIRACALLGDFPAVYDIAASTKFIPTKVPEKSVLYLHGQQTGFILLNTPAEFADFYDTLEPVFENAVDRVWLVVGYSGENDPVFERLSNIQRFDNTLYWIGYMENEPGDHIIRNLISETKDAFWVKGFDSDTFFVNLARRLGCFPPDFVRKPYTYIQHRFGSLTPYVAPKTGKYSDEIDLMQHSKRYLDFIVEYVEPAQTKSVDMMEFVFENRPVDAIKILDEFREKYGGLVPPEILSAGYMAYGVYGNQIRNKAVDLDGEESDKMFMQAIEYYRLAVGIFKHRYEAHFDWGFALQEWAWKKVGDEKIRLLKQAAIKYQETWNLNPEQKSGLLYDWGIVLSECALLKTGEEAEEFFVESVVKFKKSWELKDDVTDVMSVLYKWGLTLHDFGKMKHINGESAKEIFKQACEKFESVERKDKTNYFLYRYWGDDLGLQAEEENRDTAVKLLIRAAEIYTIAEKFNRNESAMYINWGNTFLQRVLIESGEDYHSLLNQAVEKYTIALRYNPDKSMAFSNMGLAYIYLWSFVPPEERAETVTKARKYLLCAERKSKGSGAYNLATFYALTGNFDKSRKWLLIANETKQLPLDLIQKKFPDFNIEEEKWIQIFLDDLRGKR